MGDRLDVDLPNSTYELDIILVGINHPGNLGAVCRAMLNHGFAKLSLVNPECSVDDDEARNRAKHSGRILDNVTIYRTGRNLRGTSRIELESSRGRLSQCPLEKVTVNNRVLKLLRTGIYRYCHL